MWCRGFGFKDLGFRALGFRGLGLGTLGLGHRAEHLAGRAEA